MKFTVPKPQGTHVFLLLKRAGYHKFDDPNTGKTSFAKRLGIEHFPRFHVYLKELGSEVEVDLHVDQKHASYGGQTMHSGEYDGELVEQEAVRLKALLAR